MKTLGVILARAGSEGFRNKHLKSLHGKSVIEYTFDDANDSKLLTQTIVSTDCPLIKNMARAAGFRIVDRPANLATANASVQDAMLHALKSFETESGEFFDALVVLYGNVPLRGPGVVDRAIHLLESTHCDSVRSFCPVSKWHPAWMSKLRGDKVEALVPGSIHRRQDLEPLFLHDGAVVAVSRKSMLRGLETPQDPHAFFGFDRRAITTEFGETVEIDRPRDLYLADAILREQTSLNMRVA
jgi:CMP-N,N'-diacetyllegionaminic acid synthase